MFFLINSIQLFNVIILFWFTLAIVGVAYSIFASAPDRRPLWIVFACVSNPAKQNCPISARAQAAEEEMRLAISLYPDNNNIRNPNSVTHFTDGA